jgi:hypothetical protein
VYLVNGMVLPAAVVRANLKPGVAAAVFTLYIQLAFGVLELGALIDCRASNIAPPDHQQITNSTPRSRLPTNRTSHWEFRLFPFPSRDTTLHLHFESGPPGSEWPPWPHKTATTRRRACPCRRATHCRCRRRRRRRSGISFTRGYGVNARQKSRVCLHVLRLLHPISSTDYHPTPSLPP